MYRYLTEANTFSILSQFEYVYLSQDYHKADADYTLVAQWSLYYNKD